MTRNLKLKSLPNGNLDIVNPAYRGEFIYRVTNVPADVTDREVIRRVGNVAIMRPVSEESGCRDIDWSEVSEGAIVR